ncbi:MAG: magnesium and cobalt transport protein CorA [Thermoplasmata archaeon M9B2D]|nr:MAG: magnesium and cobalt transport protein CorA [Thermoplasmata archaeon M9B2D]
MSQDDFGEKVGLPPGTVIHTGKERTEKVTICIMEFSDGQLREYEADSIDDCSPPINDKITKWVHVNGVHDVEIVKTICDFYNVHPLIIEDIPSVGQRPKLEEIISGVYIVLRSYDIDEQTNDITSEQVSIVFGSNFILSFQESPTDIFDSIRQRARTTGSRIRLAGSDYLVYSLLDLMVDKYFVVLEQVGDIIEDLEDDLIEDATVDMLNRIYSLKRSLLAFRRDIWPLRQVVLRLQRDIPLHMKADNLVYLSDLYDHVIRATDHVETYRESITGMLDIYLSRVSNKMNEVMKVLTVISTIFIPLTLMASIYGMNWPWMPEFLVTEYGYPIFLFFMIAIAVILFAYFRRIDWI